VWHRDVSLRTSANRRHSATSSEEGESSKCDDRECTTCYTGSDNPTTRRSGRDAECESVVSLAFAFRVALPDLAEGRVRGSAVCALRESLKNALSADAHWPLAPGGVVLRVEEEFAGTRKVGEESLFALTLSVTHGNGALAIFARSLARSSLWRNLSDTSALCVTERHLARLRVGAARQTHLDRRFGVRNALASGSADATGAGVGSEAEIASAV